MKLFIPELFLFITLLFFNSCVEDYKPSVKGVFSTENEDPEIVWDLQDIQNSGELIVLTLYGPDSYFEFRGEEFGNHFLLAQEFAKHIGVKARVNVCKTKKELIMRLEHGEGDIIAASLPVDSTHKDIVYCGGNIMNEFLDTLAIIENDKSIKPHCTVAWAVRQSSENLAKNVEDWLRGHDKKKMLTMSQPKIPKVNDNRHYTTYVSDEFFPEIPYFDDYPGNSNHRSSYNSNNNSSQYTTTHRPSYSMGLISYYDELFKRYAPTCGLDWRLLAAIAYNESSFNPNAVSYMGAIGLMQLMPSTARLYGVNNPYDPEQNVRGAAKVLGHLLAHYTSVPSLDERINFALAAYNAGAGHIDDARLLAKKRGKDPNIWKNNVDEFVLYMSNPDYFNDPVVKNGYFRGGETYNYVNYIRKDWDRYRNL